MSNTTLNKAKINKNDEYFTYFDDIQKEILKYRKQLSGKTIYMPCDEVYNPSKPKSNFPRFFYENFKALGLKKIIFSSYNEKWTYITIYDGVKARKKVFGCDGNILDLCVMKVIKQYDAIVITNPPFSILRKFLDYLISNDVKYLMIAPLTVITNKTHFPNFLNGKINFGHHKVRHFYTEELKDAEIPQTYWITNLEVYKVNPKLVLKENYDKDIHRKYDDWDIINVDSLSKIPRDYLGKMGVPITYIIKHNPKQFKIHGIDFQILGTSTFLIDGKKKFKRIVIQRKDINIENKKPIKRYEL